MKAAFYNGKGHMEVKEFDTPKPNEEEVLVKLKATGICGSDLNMNKAKSAADEEPSGHEVTGEIVEIGREVDRSMLGARVAVEVLGSGKSCGTCWYCRQGQYIHCQSKSTGGSGGFAEYICRKAAGCYELSDQMTWSEGALVEPLAVSVHGARIGNIKGGDTVAILGSGTIGLTAITAARELGAGKILVSARHKHQAKMAKELGADATGSSENGEFEDLVLEYTEGRGVDLTIETVGGNRRDTIDQAVEVTRRQGKIVILGVFYGEHPIDWKGPVLKEQTIQGSICYGLINGIHDFESAIEMLSKPEVNLSNIVTHTYSLDEIDEGFKTAYDKTTGSLKVHITQ